MPRKKGSAARKEEAQARASVRDQIAYEYPNTKNGPGSPPVASINNQPAHDYPEHEKLHEVREKSQAVGEFLSFGLEEQGLVLAKWGRGHRSDELFLANDPVHRILARHFGIDEQKLEQEKEQMIVKLRTEQGDRNARHSPEAGQVC